MLGKCVVLASGNDLHETKREWSQPWAGSKCKKKRKLGPRREKKELRSEESSYLEGLSCMEQKPKLTNLTSNSLAGFYNIHRKDKEPDSKNKNK